MDRSDVESSNGMHEDQPRQQVMLCREDGSSAASDGPEAIPERLQAHAATGRARSTASLADAASNLRKLDERPVPQGRSARLHQTMLCRNGGSVAAYLPSSNKAPGTSGRSR